MINVNKILDDANELMALDVSKSAKDFNQAYWDLVDLIESSFEMELLEEFEIVKNKMLERFKLLETAKSIGEVDEFAKYLSDNKININDVKTFSSIKEYTFSFSKLPKIITDYKGKNPTKDIVDIVSKFNPNPFGYSMYKNMTKAYQKGLENGIAIWDIKINFAMPPWEALDALANYSLNLTKALSDSISSSVKQALYEGISNFEGIPKLRNRILQAWNKPIKVTVPPHKVDGKVIRQGYSYNISPEQWATTVARTETARAFTEGKLESWIDSGVVEYVIYQTADDERTCPVCAPWNNVMISADKAFGLIPQHANCRCNFVPTLDKPKKGDVLGDKFIDAQICKAMCNVSGNKVPKFPDNIATGKLTPKDEGYFSAKLKANETFEKKYPKLAAKVKKCSKEITNKLNQAGMKDAVKYFTGKTDDDWVALRKLSSASDRRLPDNISDIKRRYMHKIAGVTKEDVVQFYDLLDDWTMDSSSYGGRLLKYMSSKFQGNVTTFHARQWINHNLKKIKEFNTVSKRWISDRFSSELAFEKLFRFEKELNKRLFIENFGNAKVKLYRGMPKKAIKRMGYKPKVGSKIDLQDNSLASWSTSKDVASNFGNTMLQIEVSVDDIISTWLGNGELTGFGEWEFMMSFAKPVKATITY